MACCSACIGEFGLSTRPDREEEGDEPDTGDITLGPAGVPVIENSIQVGSRCWVTVVPGVGSLVEGPFELPDGDYIRPSAADFGNYAYCVSRLRCQASGGAGAPMIIGAQELFSPEGSVSLDSGATAEAPQELVDGQPDLVFDALQGAADPLDRFQWLYMNISRNVPPLGYDDLESGDLEATWWADVTGSTGSWDLYGALICYPFATYQADVVKVADAYGVSINMYRIRLWVGVMNWVGLARTSGSLGAFVTDSAAARIQTFMDCMSEVQAFVAWQPNAGLEPELDCSNLVEYLQVYPFHRIDVWNEIDDEDANVPSVLMPIPPDGGLYAEPVGMDFALRRAALSYAGPPFGSEALYSRLGRMVKAEVWVMYEGSHGPGGGLVGPGGEAIRVQQSPSAKARVAAGIGFRCVFGDRALVGTSASFISAVDDIGSTAGLRRCLTWGDLQTVEELSDRIAALRRAASWIADDYDMDQILADRARSDA